jgi:Xaa-Pro aminopeptidase
MARQGVPALLTPDPVNIGYACGHRNMSVYGMLGPSRFLLVIAGGPTILYEFAGCNHLSAELITVDEVRQTTMITVNSGLNYGVGLERFAAEVAAECRRHHPDDLRIAVERVDFEFTDALRRSGLGLFDATAVLLESRRIKQPAELDAMRIAIDRVQASVRGLEASLREGITENEAWAEFHRDLIARDGEYVVARLFQSGPNTFPYFRESSDRAMRAGDLVCLDTDATGYLGYSVDFSRTFVCAADRGTPEQRDLFGLALAQLKHNASLIGPGVTYEDFARRAWPMPERYRPFGYYCLAHGLGVCGEHPSVPLAVAGQPFGFPGAFEPDMVVCVESYIGDPVTRQGVKLEDQYLVTAGGVELLSTYPLADSLG